MIYTSFLGPFLGMFLCKSHKTNVLCYKWCSSDVRRLHSTSVCERLTGESNVSANTDTRVHAHKTRLEKRSKIHYRRGYCPRHFFFTRGFVISFAGLWHNTLRPLPKPPVNPRHFKHTEAWICSHVGAWMMTGQTQQRSHWHHPPRVGGTWNHFHHRRFIVFIDLLSCLSCDDGRSKAWGEDLLVSASSSAVSVRVYLVIHRRTHPCLGLILLRYEPGVVVNWVFILPPLFCDIKMFCAHLPACRASETDLICHRQTPQRNQNVKH